MTLTELTAIITETINQSEDYIRSAWDNPIASSIRFN